MAAAVCMFMAVPSLASKNEDLFYSVTSGSLESVQALIEKGADVNAKDKNGDPPLQYAVNWGRPDIVALLIRKGADVHAPIQAGNLLHVAASPVTESSETVRILVDAGVAVDAKNKDGVTPLYVAAQNGRSAPLSALIARGADVNVRAPDKQTPVLRAVSNGYLDAAKLLLDNGADPNASYTWGTPLTSAMNSETDLAAALTKLLLSKGADVKGTDSQRNTALHGAARRERMEAARLLLSAHADPDARNDDGETPRSKFAAHGIDIDTLLPFATRVNAFVQSRLDPWLKKDEYESAADYAARMKGKKAKIGELMGEAFDHFGVWKSVTIGLYDAESETFKLSNQEIGDIIVSVPKARARDFKEKFASFAFKPQFAAAGKGWTLSRLEMRGAAGDAFVYDSARQANYKPVVFDVKTGAAVDTALAGGREIKTETATVTIAAADDVGRVPAFPTGAGESDVAVVIGIENYRGLAKSAYSRGDAELMKRYLLALGFKERNIALLTDDKATYIDIKKTLETWLRNVAKPESSVFVYYSGHGAPEAATGEGFIVPFDGDPEYLQDTAYPLKKLVAGLNGLGAKQAVLVLDSCFSGMGGHSALAKNARPLVAKTAAPSLGDGVAMMTASASDQVSTSSEELGHGVFTYFFLKALKDGKKNLAEIYGYARPLVEDEARRQNARQSPTMSPPPEQAKGRFALVR